MIGLHSYTKKYAMKHFSRAIVLPLLAGFSFAVLGDAEVAICEDNKSNKIFREYCLPGTTQIGTKVVRNPQSDKNAHIKTTVYSGDSCQACAAVFEYFIARNIVFEEKNIEDNLELQKELEDMTGELRVPTTIIGDAKLSGYNPAELETALVNVGYVE